MCKWSACSHMFLFPANNGLQCYRDLKDYFQYYNQIISPLTLFSFCCIPFFISYKN